MLLIIIIVVIVVLLFCLINKNTIEKFNHNKKNIEFLNKKKSCKIILKNHTHYFSLMKYKETKIRGCLKTHQDYDNRIDKCKKYYCVNTKNFSELEKKNLLLPIIIINNLYEKYYPKMLDLPWNLIKITDKIEGGMPHTISNCIVLPENFLLNLDNIINNNNKNKLIENICKTLIHEQIHVLQRNKYYIFKELYTKYWNFRLCNINLKNNYLNKQRINPDGYDNWCYKEKDYDIYPFVSLKKNLFY